MQRCESGLEDLDEVASTSEVVAGDTIENVEDPGSARGGAGSQLGVEGDAVELYRQWIANRRQLEQIVAEMETLSAAAGEILLRQAATPAPPRRSRP